MEESEPASKRQKVASRSPAVLIQAKGICNELKGLSQLFAEQLPLEMKPQGSDDVEMEVLQDSNEDIVGTVQKIIAAHRELQGILKLGT